MQDSIVRYGVRCGVRCELGIQLGVKNRNCLTLSSLCEKELGIRDLCEILFFLCYDIMIWGADEQSVFAYLYGLKSG